MIFTYRSYHPINDNDNNNNNNVFHLHQDDSLEFFALQGSDGKTFPIEKIINPKTQNILKCLSVLEKILRSM